MRNPAVTCERVHAISGEVNIPERAVEFLRDELLLSLAVYADDVANDMLAAQRAAVIEQALERLDAHAAVIVPDDPCARAFVLTTVEDAAAEAVELRLWGIASMLHSVLEDAELLVVLDDLPIV
jgi:hypothetical protein